MSAHESVVRSMIERHERGEAQFLVPHELDALRALVAEVEWLRDRAVCSGCGGDVDEGGACSTPNCVGGEMIPASGLPSALDAMRESRDDLFDDLELAP